MTISSKPQRRVFLMTLAAAAGGAISLPTRAEALLDEKDPMASGLGYVHDAKRADVKQYPKYAAGQSCASCVMYQGKAGEPTGKCPLYIGKAVSAKGWCSSYNKRG